LPFLSSILGRGVDAGLRLALRPWRAMDGMVLAETGEKPGLVLAYRGEARYRRVLELGQWSIEPLAAPSQRGVYVIVGAPAAWV